MTCGSCGLLDLQLRALSSPTFNVFLRRTQDFFGFQAYSHPEGLTLLAAAICGRGLTMSENFFSQFDSHERQTFNSRTRTDQCGIQGAIDDCWGPRSMTRPQKHELSNLQPEKHAGQADHRAVLNENGAKFSDRSHKHYDQAPEALGIETRMPHTGLTVPQTHPYFVFDSTSLKSRREQESEWLEQLREQHSQKRGDAVEKQDFSHEQSKIERDSLQWVGSPPM